MIWQTIGVWSLVVGSVITWIAAIGFRKKRLEELEADWKGIKEIHRDTY
jgi:hypothetical protein